jgi:hypothetical protein
MAQNVHNVHHTQQANKIGSYVPYSNSSGVADLREVYLPSMGGSVIHNNAVFTEHNLSGTSILDQGVDDLDYQQQQQLQ